MKTDMNMKIGSYTKLCVQNKILASKMRNLKTTKGFPFSPLTLKSKTFGPKSFGIKTSDKKLSDAFPEFRTKNIRTNTTFKGKHGTLKDVKTDCDSIINIDLQ